MGNFPIFWKFTFFFAGFGLVSVSLYSDVDAAVFIFLTSASISICISWLAAAFLVLSLIFFFCFFQSLTLSLLHSPALLPHRWFFR